MLNKADPPSRMLRAQVLASLGACVLLALLSLPLLYLHHARVRHTPHRSVDVGPFKYVDVAPAAGLTMPYDDCRNGIATMMEQAGPGVAVLDYDHDGWPDIYVLNGRDLYGKGRSRRNALYHNNRDGTFTDVTLKAGVPGTGYGIGVAVGDYDNDGYPDIYICQYGKNVLYHNNGNGTFTDVTDSAGVGAVAHGEPFHTGATWIDYDRDGRLDLFVCGYVKFHAGPRYCKIAGASKDVVSNCPPFEYDGTSCYLYHNDGHGHFTEVSRKAGVYSAGSKALTAMVLDYDGDGWPDLYVGNDGTPAYLYRNNHNGTFTDVGEQAGVARTGMASTMAAMGIDGGDYRNDGRESIVVADFADVPDHIFELFGKGFFRDATDISGIGVPTSRFLSFGAQFVDYDNDGWLDIFIANGHVYPEQDQLGNGTHYRQRSQLFRNNRDGTFTEVTDQAGPALKEAWASRGTATADFWNRGVVDILVGNNSDRPMLMKNTGTPGRHFLSLRLVGTTSNRDAIGAKVILQVGKLRQSRMVRTNNSYLSSSDPRLHFGLGIAKKVDRIEVLWPDGRRQTAAGVPADRFYQLTEGQSKLQPEPMAPPAHFHSNAA